MNCYTDIKVSSVCDLSPNTILNATFEKLHLALVECGNGEVGVSYPEFKKDLGNTIRLHGTHNLLEKLLQYRSLSLVKDYIRISQITKVPSEVKYRTVKRVQVKSPTRMLRRSVRKGWITEQEAAQRLQSAKSRVLGLPFLELSSASTRQRFKLFVEHGDCLDKPIPGNFSSYGLSQRATIPWF